MAISDELQSIQSRVNALKAPTEKPTVRRGRPSNESPAQKSAREAAKKERERARQAEYRRKRKLGLEQNSDAVSRNQPEPGAAATEFDRRSTRRSGSPENSDADIQRFVAGDHQSERDGRETEPARSYRHPRADSGNNRAEGITSRLSSAANRAVNSAFERMANLGKPKPESDDEREEEERGPSNGFHPVSAVAGFVDEEYARLFDEREADAATQDVIDMIVGYSYDIDEFLSISNVNGDRSRIWAMDNEEAGPLARLWLKRAKRDKRAAAVLRLAMQGDDYKRAVIVLGPRLWNTGTWYQRHGGFRMQPWEERKQS